MQQQMQQQLGEMQQQMQQAVRQQGQQPAQIRQEMSRSDRNNPAGLLNSHVAHPDTRLEVLYGLDNEPVQGFPKTGADIGELGGPELDALLGQLGLPVDGDITPVLQAHRLA